MTLKYATWVAAFIIGIFVLFIVEVNAEPDATNTVSDPIAHGSGNVLPRITPACLRDIEQCTTVTVKGPTTPKQEFSNGLRLFLEMNEFGPEITGSEFLPIGEFTFKL